MLNKNTYAQHNKQSQVQAKDEVPKYVSVGSAALLWHASG